jgi:hypothetical protein
LVANINKFSPAHFSFGFDSDLNVVLTASAEITTISAGTINTALGGLSINSTSTVTAAGVSPNSWVPRYRSNDGRWFQRESGQAFRGVRGVDGALSGVTYNTLQSRNVEWPYIKAENAVERANEGTAIEANTCFEAVVNYSRSRMLKYSESGNENLKGLWFIDDRSSYVGTDIGGSSLETWVNGTPNVGDPLWCTSAAPVIGGNSDPRLNTFYECSATLTSATPPTWAVANGPV